MSSYDRVQLGFYTKTDAKKPSIRKNLLKALVRGRVRRRRVSPGGPAPRLIYSESGEE